MVSDRKVAGDGGSVVTIERVDQDVRCAPPALPVFLVESEHPMHIGRVQGNETTFDRLDSGPVPMAFTSVMVNV